MKVLLVSCIQELKVVQHSAQFKLNSGEIMKKTTAILSMFIALISFNAPKANAGVLTILGAGSDNNPVNFFSRTVGLAAIVVGMAKSDSLLFILDSGDVAEFEQELAHKFPFIDDAYAIRTLADAVIEAKENQVGISHNENTFEVIVPEANVKSALEPTTLLEAEVESVVNTLSRPLQL